MYNLPERHTVTATNNNKVEMFVGLKTRRPISMNRTACYCFWWDLKYTPKHNKTVIKIDDVLFVICS